METSVATAITLAKQGVSLHGMKHILRSNPVISFPFADRYLEKYYVLYWDPKYFKLMLHDGIIAIQDGKEKIRYQVSFIGCNANDIMKRQQIKLSFRKPKPQYPVGNFVVITIPLTME